MLVAVAAAILSAIVAIQIKQLSKTDAADTIVLWTYLFWVPISLLPALAVWQWPQGIAWLWLALSGSIVKGVVLALVGVLVLGNVDNVVRPLMLAGTARMSTLMLIISLLGGVITGEHGIGLAKKPWWSLAASKSVRDLHHRVKNALDPNGILNPGKFLG